MKRKVLKIEVTDASGKQLFSKEVTSPDAVGATMALWNDDGVTISLHFCDIDEMVSPTSSND